MSATSSTKPDFSQLPWNQRTFGNTLPSDPKVCFWCSRPVSNFSKTRDHIQPKNEGGILANQNKTWCCFDCNQFKGRLGPESWLKLVQALIRSLDRQRESQIRTALINQPREFHGLVIKDIGRQYKKRGSYLSKIANKLNLVIQCQDRTKPIPRTRYSQDYFYQ